MTESRARGVGALGSGRAFPRTRFSLIQGLKDPNDIARRTGSLTTGVVTGLAVAVALALPVAYLNANHYQDISIYWKIILPGEIAGMVVGYGIVRFGRQAS